MSAVVESAAKPASSGVDNASKAKSALHKIEELSKEIAKNEKVKMCREAWIIFGAALLAQRETMPSTRAYGDWVKEHHLDTGLAKSPVTRADAVWMAAHRRELSELKGLRNHFPSGLRQELRDAGYTWAVKSAGEEEGGDARPADTKVPRRGRAKSQSYRPPHPTTTVGGESDDESTVETSDASTGNDGTRVS